MVLRLPVNVISIILLAGAILLQIFLILGGDSYGTPTNRIYFLQTTTNGIPGARNPSRWTFFRICGAGEGDRNTNCGSYVPALPFYPQGRSNFDTTTGIPDRFLDTRKYYYMSRFAFAFFLISLAFGALALLTSLLALCTRLGSYITALNTAVAAFFQGITAALLTAEAVQGRNGFRNAGQEAKIGTYAQGFLWTAFACYFLTTLTFCLGGTMSKSRKRESTVTNGHAHSRRSGGGFFGRKSSTRSRGSFGTKEEYA